MLSGRIRYITNPNTPRAAPGESSHSPGVTGGRAGMILGCCLCGPVASEENMEVYAKRHGSGSLKCSTEGFFAYQFPVNQSTHAGKTIC